MVLYLGVVLQRRFVINHICSRGCPYFLITVLGTSSVNYGNKSSRHLLQRSRLHQNQFQYHFNASQVHQWPTTSIRSHLYGIYFLVCRYGLHLTLPVALFGTCFHDIILKQTHQSQKRNFFKHGDISAEAEALKNLCKEKMITVANNFEELDGFKGHKVCG